MTGQMISVSWKRVDSDNLLDFKYNTPFENFLKTVVLTCIYKVDRWQEVSCSFTLNCNFNT